MAQAMGSKEAAAVLIDPIVAPEPSAETGLNSHFGSTFAPAPASHSRNVSNASANPSTPSRNSLSSNNPFRQSAGSQRSSRSTPPSKSGAVTNERPVSRDGREPFPGYRAEAFAEYGGSRSRSGSGRRSGPPPSYDAATSPNSSPATRHRRHSSLKERFPGDDSVHPLDIIRRDSKKAHRSPHLRKHHLPGPDTIDRLDPAIGGHAYHHEGPYDAALLARNNRAEISPIAALQMSNEEALKATPDENIKNAVERHRPLEGVADVPPGLPDRFGRTYNYEEGADLMHEENNDGPGYKRWGGKEYSPDDLKGQGDSFALDKAFKAHKISDSGIELQETSQLMKDYNKQKRDGTLDERDPVVIAGDDSKYVDAELARAHDNDIPRRSGSIRDGLKKRIGSLRKKNRDD